MLWKSKYLAYRKSAAYLPRSRISSRMVSGWLHPHTCASPIGSLEFGAGNLLETVIVTESRGGLEAGNELDLFLESADIEVAPVTPRQVSTARRAWRRFGKGRHRAKLNFGDCFACALSATTGEPLLFKGNDFTQTDVNAALPPP